MLRGGRKDLESDACANSSVEQEWSQPSSETIFSKSMCKGGRRKQSKPVKMLRSDDDGMETEGGVGGVCDFNESLELNDKAKEEEKGSYAGKEIHKLWLCSAREISARSFEKSYAELTEGFHKEPLFICHKESDRKLSDVCLEGGKSEASLNTEGTAAERDCGDGVSDPCEGADFKRLGIERRNAVGTGSSWSRVSGSVIGEESDFLDEKCLNVPHGMSSRNGEERNVTEEKQVEESQIIGTYIMEDAVTCSATDSKVKETVTAPYSEQSETTNGGTTFDTRNQKVCKTMQASGRQNNGIVLTKCGESTLISRQKDRNATDISNRKPSKTLETSNRGACKTLGILNREASKTIEISHREVKEILERGSNKREDKCDKHIVKTESIRFSSDYLYSEAAANLSSQNQSDSHSDSNEVTVVTLEDSLQGSVHSQLDKLHQSSIPFSSSTYESKIADSCKTSMRQCVVEDYCDICQKRFCNKYYLRKHRQDVHGLVKSDADGMMRTARGSTKGGADDTDIQGFRFGADSPTGGSSSVFSSEALTLEKTMQGSGERVSFSSATSTPLLNYLVFTGAVNVPPKRTLPTPRHESHHERLVFGSSESNPGDLSHSQLANALSFITDGLQAAPGFGFLDAYLRLCRDVGGGFNGKSEWEQSIYKRHDRGSAVLSQSLADFQTDAFVKFQDNYLAIAKARKVAAQCAAMDRSGTSYGGVFPLGGKRSFDFLSSSFAGKNDDYASEVMTKLLKADRFLSSGAESTKTVSGFGTGKLSDRVVCDLCGKEVCNKYFLKTHKTKVHGWQEGSSSQTSDRSVGLGPFSSTLSYLVDGLSSSKHVAGGETNLATKSPCRRKPSEETQSTDFFSKDLQTKDPINGFHTIENTRTMSRADTINCQSTLKNSPYRPFWSNNEWSSPATHTLVGSEISIPESLLGQQGKWKEEGSTSRITCRLCNKVVPNKHILKTHLKRRHGIGGWKNKGDVKSTELDGNFRSPIETGNSASRIHEEDSQAKESNPSKSFSQYMNEDADVFVNYEIGSEVVGQRLTTQTPDRNGAIGTRQRDEEWEKSSTENDILDSLPNRRDSITKTQAGSSTDLEQTNPSKIMNDPISVQDGGTSIYTSPVARCESVMRRRERGESRMRLSSKADTVGMDTHLFDLKTTSLCSKDGFDTVGRIRCFLCRKSFRSNSHFNIHLRKVHASVLPNPSDNSGTTDNGTPGIDDNRCQQTNTRGKQLTEADISPNKLDGIRNGNLEVSSPKGESPAVGVGRRSGAKASMQPFLLREVPGLDLFCPAVVYLPSLRTMTNPTSVTFTLTPMVQEELGQFT